VTQTPYNPLEQGNLAHSIMLRMEETEPTPLGSVKKFQGAGLYAIYYSGDHPAYEVISALNSDRWTTPIYVGKAVPSGGRRGLDVTASHGTEALSKRIREHAKSIIASPDLSIDAFVVRWLVVEDIWIALGESAMIRAHRPVWNALVDGFGNHDPGKGRANGIQSRWDTLHPGRTWVGNFPPRAEAPTVIEQDIREYLRARYQV